MLLITCPHCGPRAEIEFRYGGEAHRLRQPDGTSDEQWGNYLYGRHNRRGAEHVERWRHFHGCGRFFNLCRDTMTDTILGSGPPTGGARATPGQEDAARAGDATG